MTFRMTLAATALAALTLAGCGSTTPMATGPAGAVDPDPLSTQTDPGQLIGDPLLQNQDDATMETRTGN